MAKVSKNMSIRRIARGIYSECVALANYLHRLQVIRRFDALAIRLVCAFGIHLEYIWNTLGIHCDALAN